MADASEVEERVDLEEDNYMEEMDDDVEEHVDEDGVDRRAGELPEEDVEEVSEEPQVGTDTEDKFSGDGRNNLSVESIENREKSASLLDEDELEKHAQLLALPPHGSEVFIGGLSRDVLEEDLREMCESLGEIFEIRIIKDKDSGESKGYAFIAFKTKEAAQKAIEDLHGKEVKVGKTIRCSLSDSKHRLFIGNVPKSWTDDEFRRLIEGVGPGVENIELIKDPQNPNRNRGFAFVLYYNNACADYSRQKMSSANFKLDGNSPTVSWADPKSMPDNTAAAQVKALYVKNIPENTTTEQLKELFQQHGEVTKVNMPPGKAGSSKRDFAFIHYAERSSALKAVKETEKYEIEGQLLEVVLAKPQSDKKSDGAYSHISGSYPNHLLHGGYGGYGGNPYGSIGGYGVTAGFHQPMIYGRGPMPAGMQMVPMVLPDGRIGYVLQQPGVPMPPSRSRRSERSNGSGGTMGRSGGSSSSDDVNRGRRYRPY
ncbi:heterogeneous nuclear ribonucleoprotein Q isoform X1 [Cucumis melo]|uniref:Heterogeneous nuclear ribonucleoprotein R isoform X1 n=1 Tax=Cucumis melo TaxID=3656 RepID=A0A1S3AUK8_CUCME|nr:heterogeneous nuclear ribonucleoprotein Q isoform X1 [Cucumis melo]XP_008437830.1 heterogeneous nuclear ribonucleoprotein Q isoform X1 [Cucumis melo]